MTEKLLINGKFRLLSHKEGHPGIEFTPPKDKAGFELIIEPGVEVSDSYHTFDELYQHRNLLYCALSQNDILDTWKSKHHWQDAKLELCPEGWFLAGINLYKPAVSQITYHLPVKFWDLFRGEVLDKPPIYDGHTSQDVLVQLVELIRQLEVEVSSTIDKPEKPKGGKDSTHK